MKISKHAFSKKSLLIGAVCLGVATVGFLVWRPNGEKVTIVPNAEAGVLKVNETLPIKKSHASYVSINDMALSTQERQEISKKIKNLTTTGSSTGGVLTTEFKQSTHAKMSYRFGRKQPLAFEMIKIKSFLPSSFVLTGRQYEGEKSEQGFNGLYQFFENPTTKARFELTQTKITKPTTFVKELFNENIDGVPLRLESLSDKQGNMYYYGEFVVNDIHLMMTSKGLSLPEFMAVVIGVIDGQKR